MHQYKHKSLNLSKQQPENYAPSALLSPHPSQRHKHAMQPKNYVARRGTWCDTACLMAVDINAKETRAEQSRASQVGRPYMVQKYLKADKNRSLRQGSERREHVHVVLHIRHRSPHAGGGGHAQRCTRCLPCLADVDTSHIAHHIPCEKGTSADRRDMMSGNTLLHCSHRKGVQVPCT